MKVFLVEDSPTIRDNLAATLEELAPVTVVGAAATEGEAVSWLAGTGHGCDLAIVDLALAAGSGYGVLRMLQQHPGAARRCIVLTNYAAPDVRRRCAELGALRVFDKSSEIDALVDYCRTLAH